MVANGFENQLWHRIFRKFSIILSIKAMLVTLLSYFAGYYLSSAYHFALPQIAGLWCAISGIVVLQVTITESLSAAGLRIIGSFIGTFCAFIFATLLGFTVFALALTMLTTVMITSLFKIKHALRLACLTGQVVIIVGMVAGNVSPFWNCASRFAESVIGAVIAIAITSIFYPLRKKLQLLNH